MGIFKTSENRRPGEFSRGDFLDFSAKGAGLALLLLVLDACGPGLGGTPTQDRASETIKIGTEIIRMWDFNCSALNGAINNSIIDEE